MDMNEYQRLAEKRTTQTGMVSETSMSYGTFCRICHKLIAPGGEQICVECKDAMKRAGYEKVVHCEECKHGGFRTHKLDGSVFRVVCKKHGTKKNELWMPADFYCYDGDREEE